MCFGLSRFELARRLEPYSRSGPATRFEPMRSMAVAAARARREMSRMQVSAMKIMLRCFGRAWRAWFVRRMGVLWSLLYFRASGFGDGNGFGGLGSVGRVWSLG